MSTVMAAENSLNSKAYDRINDNRCNSYVY